MTDYKQPREVLVKMTRTVVVKLLVNNNLIIKKLICSLSFLSECQRQGFGLSFPAHWKLECKPYKHTTLLSPVC